MKFVSAILGIATACTSPMLLGAPVDSPASAPSPAVTAPAPAPPAPKAWTARWLDLRTFSHAQRYRNSDDQDGFHLFEDGQQRSLVEGSLKLDAADRYSIAFRASSGRYFNWAYADYAGDGLAARKDNPVLVSDLTPAQQYEVLLSEQADPKGYATLAGLQSAGWEFYLRELYLSATPVKPVTVEFGSLGIERGLSSEITTFDDDGFVSGERIRIHDAKHLFFDQVGYTNAFFGDIGTPNLFSRGASLESFNYRQVFADKQLNTRVGFSGEYTWLLGTDTLREAAVVATPEAKVVEKIRAEFYQRTDTVTLQGLPVHGGSGFAVTGERKFGDHLSGDVGYAIVDKDYSVYSGSRFFHAFGFSLNGDTYSQGNRIFMHAAYKINPVVTAFGFYTHVVAGDVITQNQEGINGGLSFDLKALVNTEKRVF